jgi:hypothetical protein
MLPVAPVWGVASGDKIQLHVETRYKKPQNSRFKILLYYKYLYSTISICSNSCLPRTRSYGDSSTVTIRPDTHACRDKITNLRMTKQVIAACEHLFIYICTYLAQ